MFTSIARLFHNWKRYGDAMQELSQLSDRELVDIGISRSEIPRLAREHAQMMAEPAPAPTREPARRSIPLPLTSSPGLLPHDAPGTTACLAQ